ncbi:kinase-like domain-containing protein [Mycena alexandri]|uniref:Kinase-like domain-containing protein n=1 Tax=Mycena alexandri TaxID=1745969 RepID=A0AAD6XD73_9AGAR|nr:kinase-like domain-containing protein [Mycena alexandri]
MLHTPPRTNYDSPMLTPSPLRRDDLFFNPRPTTPEDTDALVFVASPSGTPAKRVPSRTPLSLNTNTHGTKRKSTATPLRLAQGASSVFHRLAPLPAPQFTTRTPQSAAETDAHLHTHTATLTRLRIDDEFGRTEEVVEACSPGGHITKRRARSRPVSQELLQGSPSPPVAFPRACSPVSSSSETGSPLPRRRITGAYPSRAPLERIESAATLFFGPPINPPRARLTSATSATLQPASTRPSGRHSYAGPGCSTQSWSTMRSRPATPSPRSSPATVPVDLDDDDDQDMDTFFGAARPNPSFMFSVNAGTPSPRTRKPDAPLAKKYSLRDSGVVLTDDDDDDGDHLMPRASTSVSSIYSDEGLVTPGVEPEAGSGWPSVVDPESNSNMDAFISRTLAAGAKAGAAPPKKAPGTPVKRVKTSYLVADRPWQSAVAHKVGIPGFSWEAKGKAAPRKSLPAVFPALPARKHGKAPLDPATDSEGEGEDESPSGRRDKYVGLGMGRPGPNKSGVAARTRWLTRRSSSGAFSSGSDSASLSGTPTRAAKGREWHLPKVGAGGLSFSPSNDALNLSPGRSSTTSASRSPSGARYVPVQARGAPVPVAEQTRPGAVRRLSDQAVERAGYFERAFEEVDELGSGEFGKVIKVRSRAHHTEYAVKKSKRFEGVRHRLRLREEVEILQHLTCGGVQPNVLTFVDSWEEDDVLYIQTELCALGNFARFLWEFGRVFPRLDEGRIWKIVVDLSNGLQFIHGAGVIHLDLKPSNIFVTGEGRFKIGDFGMASVWPRTRPRTTSTGGSAGTSEAESVGLGFEREGDKVYLAPEVLQGEYGKAADVFSFGMTMLETASNMVIPDQGEAWLRLRREDYSQVELDDMPELFGLIRGMMRTAPAQRLAVEGICGHPIVARAREWMNTHNEAPLAPPGPGLVDYLGVYGSSV